MIEINLAHAADLALRAWLMFTGLLVAGHYHCMANFSGRAPLVIKYAVLPAATFAGVGMAVAGGVGMFNEAAYFSFAVAGLMVTVNLAAFASGAYVSEQFERADRMKRYRNAFLREAINGSEDLARLLEQDSDTAPLTAERKERHKA
jgi:hypothetical protein